MAWGSGGGWGPKKPKSGGGQAGPGRAGQGSPGGQNGAGTDWEHAPEVPRNFPGEVRSHPGWVDDGKPNGSCSAHPGGCKDSRVGSGCQPGWF